MTQVLQLLMVIAVGVSLAVYGHFVGKKERCHERKAQGDSRQRELFSQHSSHELVSRV
jgi:hypothetical protein